MSEHPTYVHARDTAGGWADLDDPQRRFNAQMAELGNKRRQLAQSVARILDTADGQALIEHLLDKTLRRQPVMNLLEEPVAITAEQLMPRVLAHNGAVAIVEEILLLDRIGRQPPTATET